MLRVHVLEGHDVRAAQLIMVCGRRMRNDGYIGRVRRWYGRAWVLQGMFHDAITCARCRAKMGLTAKGGGG